jgi:hypothetical protein
VARPTEESLLGGTRMPYPPHAHAGLVRQGWSARAVGIHAQSDTPPRDSIVKEKVLTTWVPPGSVGAPAHACGHWSSGPALRGRLHQRARRVGEVGRMGVMVKWAKCVSQAHQQGFSLFLLYFSFLFFCLFDLNFKF